MCEPVHLLATEVPAITQALHTLTPVNSRELARRARVADENRARDIVVLDVRGQTPIFDYFIIATGSSRRQLHAISDEIDRLLAAEYGQKRLGIEGYVGSRWILLDYGDIVVHLFDPEAQLLCAGRSVVRGQTGAFEPAAPLRAIS